MTFIAKHDNFITKCDSYCNIQRLLQIVTVQPKTLLQLNSVDNAFLNVSRYFSKELLC